MKKLMPLLAFACGAANATPSGEILDLAHLTESYFKCAAVTGDQNNVRTFEEAALKTGRRMFAQLAEHPEVKFSPSSGLHYYFLDDSLSVDFRLGMAYMSIVQALPKRDYGKGTPQEIVASGLKAFNDMNCSLISPK